MIELLNFKFKGVGRFVDEQEIDLTSRPNLLQVNAQNRNTGGSSGGGKTTVFKAVNHLLGVDDVTIKSIKSRYAKEWKIEGNYLNNGRPLKITRSSSGSSIEGVDENGIDFSVSGNSDQVEEKLDHILGLSRNLFRLITYKKQGETGFFLNLTPKEVFEFMMKVLGLESEQKKLVKLSEELTKKQVVLDQKTSALNTYLELYEKAKLDRSQIAEPAFTLSDNDFSDQILKKQSEIIAIEYAINSVKKEMALAVENVPRPEPKAFSAPVEVLESIALKERNINQLITEAQAKRQAQNVKLDSYKTAEGKLIAAIKSCDLDSQEYTKNLIKIERLESDLKKMALHTCPKCEQNWENDHLKNEKDKTLKELEMLKNINLEKLEKIDSKAPLELKLTRLKEIIKNSMAETVDTTEIDQARSELMADKNKLIRLESEVRSANLLLNSQYLLEKSNVERDFSTKESELKTLLSNLNDEIYRLKLAISENDRKREALESAARASKQALGSAKINYENALGQKLQAEKDYNLSEEAKRAIKSYTMRIFEDALDVISERATNILCKIPNMSTATIYFEPFKELTSGPNKGKIKEEITAILNMDGEEGVPVKDISGGERAAIDLAVDLAVIDFVEERSGVGANYFILDEPCTGMDVVCKEQYIEILKNCGSKKKIIIVDHSPEVKEMVEDTILVIREGLYSRVENNG